jgi:hypothetical protein
MEISQDQKRPNYIKKRSKRPDYIILVETIAIKIADKGGTDPFRTHSSIGAYGSFWTLQLSLNYICGGLLPFGRVVKY